MRVLIALLALLLPATASAQVFVLDFQDTPPFQLRYGSGLASSLNVTDEDHSGSLGAGTCNGSDDQWYYTHFADGSGWNGRNFVRFFRCEGDVPSGAPDAGERRTGWNWNMDTVAPTGGWSTVSPGPLYWRWRMRVNTPLTQSQGQASQKHIVFGGPGLANGCDRMIFQLYAAGNNGGNEATQLALGPVQGVCGDQDATAPGNGANGSAMGLIDVGDWVHVQVKAVWGAHGALTMALYLDNNVEGSPTVSTTASYDGASAWNYPNITGNGDFGNGISNNSASGQRASIDYMDYQMGTTFDASWAPGGEEPPANPPVRVPLPGVRVADAAPAGRPWLAALLLPFAAGAAWKAARELVAVVRL
jgi:hypothetical protein